MSKPGPCKIYTLRNSACGILTVKYGPVFHCSSPYIFSGASLQLFGIINFIQYNLHSKLSLCGVFTRVYLYIIANQGQNFMDCYFTDHLRSRKPHPSSRPLQLFPALYCLLFYLGLLLRVNFSIGVSLGVLTCCSLLSLVHLSPTLYT